VDAAQTAILAQERERAVAQAAEAAKRAEAERKAIADAQKNRPRRLLATC
jgi:G:T/U-mismatch repair DNA glycosylase